MSVSRNWVGLLAAAVIAGVLPVSGQLAPFGGAREYIADLAARREQTRNALGPDTVLVVWSAPRRVYSADIDYEYRQDSNLLYLTGIDQEDTILVLVPGASFRKEWLFVRKPDAVRELWTDHTFTSDEVTERSGISAVVPQAGTEAFDAFMAALLGATDRGQPAASVGEFNRFARAVRAREARLAVLAPIGRPARPGVAGSDAAPTDARAVWALEMQRRYPGVTAVGVESLLARERAIKTPYEQRVLTRSVEISAEAHVAGMRATRPERWEYEVEAAIEYWFLAHGAMSWGYPSMVASGPNALTLHYLKSTRQMQAGEMLLVDAAGSYQGLTGDITRTYPVSGRFTPAQRALYDLVLSAQEAGIAAAGPGSRPAGIVAAVRAAFARGLKPLGLIVDDPGVSESAQLDLWFPHSPVHGIGMDVHDAIEVLDPGAAFVIEPGLYIRPAALDALADTPERAMVAARLRPAVEKYRNIGVRIEDSFLMTSTGPRMLSVRAPRRPAELEKVVGKDR